MAGAFLRASFIFRNLNSYIFPLFLIFYLIFERKIDTDIPNLLTSYDEGDRRDSLDVQPAILPLSSLRMNLRKKEKKECSER